jgi:Endonuclease-reverse transcriptase
MIAPLSILSVNMRCRNAMLYALLQTSDSDIIAVQEPWFGLIRTDRSDSSPSGIPVYGTAHNNLWHCFHPPTVGDLPFKTAIFIKQKIMDAFQVLLKDDDTLSSPSSMIVDISSSPTDTLRLINIYHNVPEAGHNLDHVLALTLDPDTPTLVVGDFNTHSRQWSLPDARPSLWSGLLEAWFHNNALLCLNPPDVTTWRGPPGHKASVLDLFLLNAAAILTDQVGPPLIFFDLSLGSDHAGILAEWTPTALPEACPCQGLPGYKIEDELRQQWEALFAGLPRPTVDTPAEVTEAADSLIQDIDQTSAQLFDHWTTPDPRGVRWWSEQCKLAIQVYKTA